MNIEKLPNVQRRIYELLLDGKPHPRQELIDCLNDSLSTRRNIQPHLTMLRKQLRPIGQDIICQLLNRRCCYRIVILLSSSRE